jgi:hypothetical protein
MIDAAVGESVGRGIRPCGPWDPGRTPGGGMTFEELFDQALTMLQSRGRVSYRL